LHEEHFPEPVEVGQVYSKLFELFLFRNSEVRILVCSDLDVEVIKTVFLTSNSLLRLQNLVVVKAAANKLPFFFDEVDVDDWSDYNANGGDEFILVADVLRSVVALLVHAVAGHLAGHGGLAVEVLLRLFPKGDAHARLDICLLPLEVRVVGVDATLLVGHLLVLLAHAPLVFGHPRQVQTVVQGVAERHVLGVQVQRREVTHCLVQKVHRVFVRQRRALRLKFGFRSRARRHPVHQDWRRLTGRRWHQLHFQLYLFQLVSNLVFVPLLRLTREIR